MKEKKYPYKGNIYKYKDDKWYVVHHEKDEHFSEIPQKLPIHSSDLKKYGLRDGVWVSFKIIYEQDFPYAKIYITRGTRIELVSDEEIESYANRLVVREIGTRNTYIKEPYYKKGFMDGADWMRKKIK